jgi:hypothetical protein
MPISIAEIQAHPAEAIAALVETVRRQEVEIDRLWDNFGIVMDLVAKLRPKEPEDSKLLDELYAEMTAIGRKQVDFKTAARMVKRSKSRLLQIKPLIGQDMRFMLVPSESHSQKILIRLRDKPTN